MIAMLRSFIGIFSGVLTAAAKAGPAAHAINFGWRALTGFFANAKGQRPKKIAAYDLLRVRMR
jgi:hypothetical protein